MDDVSDVRTGPLPVVRSAVVVEPQYPPPRISCRRCGRLQPPVPYGIRHCLHCGTALSVRRWAAHPPPSADPDPIPAPRPRGLTPRYPTVPRWGFPASIWVPDRAEKPDTPAMPVRGLSTAALACVVTAVLAVIAAGAEAWRFALVLRGRGYVLDARVVRASDLLEVAAGWLLLAVGLLTVLLVAAALVAAHPAAHRFAGAQPTRRPIALWLRLGVPGWNLVGAGEVVLETDAALGRRISGDDRPRSSGLVRWWWAAFAASEILTVAAILRSLGTSDQARADSIELRIAVNLVCAALSVTTAVLLRRFLRLISPPRALPKGWTVAPAAPTRARPADPAAARRRSGQLPPTGSAPLPALDELPRTSIDDHAPRDDALEISST